MPTEPMAVQAALELATIELERNRPEAALAILNTTAKNSPQSPLKSAVQFRSAEALRKLKRLDEAEKRFLNVVETDPSDAWADDALQRAAQTALERGDAPTALERARAFASRFPRSPLRGDVRLIEARAAARTGDHRAAMAILESLLEPPGGSNGGPAPSLSATSIQDARYELALAYRALGRPAEADAILASLSESANSPIAADALFLLGQEHVEAGRYARAIGPLERYLSAKPQGDVAEFALAHLAAAQLGAGRADDAWKSLQTLADRFPASKVLPRTRVRLAESALAAHQPDRAAEQFRLVAGAGALKKGTDTTPPGSKEPKLPVEPPLRNRALVGLGRALSELGKPTEAARSFAAFLEVAPTDPMAPAIALAQARALEAANQLGEALVAYERAAEKFTGTDPGVRAVLARARLLSRVGRHTDAAVAFERLVSDPSLRESLARTGTTVERFACGMGLVAGGCLQTGRGRPGVHPSSYRSSPKSLCGRCAVQPGGIGLPGS